MEYQLVRDQEELTFEYLDVRQLGNFLRTGSGNACERQDLQNRFYQQPGDLLVLNNWTTLHRRSEFVDQEDPAGIETALASHLAERPQQSPNDPLFNCNFNATDAGVIRSGMRAMK